MALISAAEKYWIQNESGLINSSLTRYYCQFITSPNIGVFLKVARYFKAIDTPIYSPMETYDLLAFISPSISKSTFNKVANKHYDKTKSDRGAKDAFIEIAHNYELTCIYSDERSSQEALHKIKPLKTNQWNGDDLDCIPSVHIQALADSLHFEQEWEPSPTHPSWQNTPRH